MLGHGSSVAQTSWLERCFHTAEARGSSPCATIPPRPNHPHLENDILEARIASRYCCRSNGYESGECTAAERGTGAANVAKQSRTPAATSAEDHDQWPDTGSGQSSVKGGGVSRESS